MSWLVSPIGLSYWQLESSSENKDVGTLAAIYAALQVANEALEVVDRVVGIIAKIRGLFGRPRSSDEFKQILSSLSVINTKLDLLLAGMTTLASREDLEDSRMRERSEHILGDVSSATIKESYFRNAHRPLTHFVRD